MEKYNYVELRKMHLNAIKSCRTRGLGLSKYEDNPVALRSAKELLDQAEEHRKRLVKIRESYYKQESAPLTMHERWALDDSFGSGFRVVEDKRPPLEFDQLRCEQINGRIYEYKVGRTGLTYYNEPGNHKTNWGSTSWMYIIDMIRANQERAKLHQIRMNNPEKSMSVGDLKEKLNSEEEDFFDYGEITVRVGDKLYRVKDVVHGDHGAEILIREEEYQHYVKHSNLD